MKAPAVALVLCAACSAGEKPPPAKLWTVEDVRRLAREGKSFAGMPAASVIALRGQPLPLLSPPFSDVTQVQRGDRDGLNVAIAFSEGQPAAYTTTEFWQGFPAVWVQPLYFPIAGFENGAVKTVPGGRAIFSVGTRTRFYSPYWQIHYVIVPDSKAAAALRSTKAVLDSGYPIVEGPGTFCALAPEDVRIAQAEGATESVQPLFGDRVTARYFAGWVENEEVWYVDFGRNRFTWNDAGVIDEAALFDFVGRADDGRFFSLGLPRVGGTGPLHSNTPPRVANGRPQFGALWRIYQALLPAGSGVFIPSSRAALRSAVIASSRNAGIAPAIAPENEALPVAVDYTLRVATNPACFLDTKPFTGFPASCRWLDSQTAVEAAIGPNLIQETDILVSCPFVTYANTGIDPL